MAGDKIRPRDAVPVEKYAICSVRGQYRLIANLGGAEPTISVPDVLKTAADFCLPAFDQPCSGWSGAIIGNNNLESGVPLPRKRSQDCIERIFAIIRRDDDRNQFGHIPNTPGPTRLNHVLRSCASFLAS